MGVTGSGEVLITPPQRMFLIRIHTGRAWGGRAAGPHSYWSKQERRLSRRREAVRPHVLTCSVRLTGWPVCRTYVL